MPDLYGKRIDSSYFYILNSDPNTAIVTNGDGSNVDWDGNKIVLKTGNQDISGVKNFNSIPTYQGLELVYKNNPLSGLGEGQLQMAQNSQGSVILAGNVNTLSGNYSVILAGTYNDLKGDGSLISAGTQNSLNGNFSFIGAGAGNSLTGNSSTINGGIFNDLIGLQSSISAGNSNQISGNRSFIGAGKNNIVNSDQSAIAGGDGNQVHSDFGGILAGVSNTISGGASSVIAGGHINYVEGVTSSILGGDNNKITGNFSFIGGGEENKARVSNYSAIVVGENNNIDNSVYSFIAGGTENSIIGSDNGVILTPNSSIINTNTDVTISFTTADTGRIEEVGFGAQFTKFPFQDADAIREFDGSPAPWYTWSAVDGFERISGYWFEQKAFDAPVYASILNGIENKVQSDFSTILNGSGNELAGANSIVAGINNKASGHNSYIFGGTGNTINLSFLTGSSSENLDQGFLYFRRDYENYNTIINGENNVIGSNKASERFVLFNNTNLEAVQNKHSHIFGGEENSIDGIGGFILNGKRNDIHAVTHSLNEEFNMPRTSRNQPINDPYIPELDGIFEDDFLQDFNGTRETWESHSSIFSSVRCSVHGQLLSISNSVNSSIESGYRGISTSSFQHSDNYPIFCNISNSLGSSVKAAHYSSIFNGIGNEISQSGTRIRSANSTILNGNRNKILTEVSELDAIDVANNTYSTILNGRNNTIYGRRSTIINGTENTLTGRSNLIFGEGNTITDQDNSITYSAPDFSFVFGEDNLVSGAAFTTQLSKEDGNYVFGKRNQLLNCSRSFVVGGYKVFNQGGFLLDGDNNKFILSYDIFSFNNVLSSVSGSHDSAINNVYYSDVAGAVRSSLSNLDGSDIVGLSNSFANNLVNSNARSILSSNLNGVEFSQLSGLNRCTISNLRNSDITDASDSRIQGNNINVDNDLDYSDILGNNINLTGRVLVGRSRIVGQDIDFVKLGGTATFVEFGNCDVLGFNNTLAAVGGSISNLLIRGYNNNVTGSSNVFVFGDRVNVNNSRNSVFFGEDIESSGQSTFIFGDNINSQHVAGSVIKDSKTTATQSKGEDTLFLDFDQGTYMNVPLWTGATTPGVGGQIMYSGDNMYIHNGSNWREINTSAV
jgi:hypothetical protein